MLVEAGLLLSSELKPVLVQGWCHAHGVKQWPLAFERWSMIGTVHPDPGKRSVFDVPQEPDPLEVVIAAEALACRYRAF